MPPKSKPITESFLDDSFAALTASLKDTLHLEIAKSIETLKTEVIANLLEQNKLLAARVKVLETKVQTQSWQIDEIFDLTYDLEAGLYDQQQRSRRKNIEIAGIPNEVLDENLEKTVVSIINLSLEDENPLKSTDFDACHRLPAKNGPKPVIVRFVSRKRRNEVYAVRDDLNNHNHARFGVEEGQRLYINQNLSPVMKKLAYYGRKLKRENVIVKTASDYGMLKIKIKERGRWIKIKHEFDLRSYFPNFPFDDDE